MIQQGQVFKLKAIRREPLWAYRYRVAGRGSVGGSGRGEAQRALRSSPGSCPAAVRQR